jgi:hypothetical protein
MSGYNQPISKVVKGKNAQTEFFNHLEHDERQPDENAPTL